jgi:hypothetical protein
MMKKLLYRTLWILVFAFTMVLVVWANMEQSNSHCSDISVTMNDTDYPALTSEEIVKTQVLKEMPQLVGQTLSNIELYSLEEYLLNNTQLEDVKTFININGNIEINYIDGAKDVKVLLGERIGEDLWENTEIKGRVKRSFIKNMDTGEYIY